MDSELGFRIVKERGRHLVRRRTALEVGGPKNRAASAEEVVLWTQRRELRDEVRRLREQLSGRTEADEIADLARVGRRHAYDCLRTRERLVRIANKGASALRVAALMIGELLEWANVEDAKKGKTRRDVARDTASEISGAIRDHEDSCRATHEALGVGKAKHWCRGVISEGFIEDDDDA